MKKKKVSELLFAYTSDKMQAYLFSSQNFYTYKESDVTAMLLVVQFCNGDI